MKKYFTVIFVMVNLSIAVAVDTVPTANIRTSSEWGKAQCAAQPGKGVILGWKGIEDMRQVQAVGTLKKGKEEFEVNLSRPVKDVFAEAVITAFRNCGFEVRTKDDGAGGIAASVDVNEFFAGSKKGFFTGETDARGSVTLHFSGSGRTFDFDLGATKSDKRLRKKNIKQLEEVLTGLLDELAAQVGGSPTLFSNLKELAGGK